MTSNEAVLEACIRVEVCLVLTFSLHCIQVLKNPTFVC